MSDAIFEIHLDGLSEFKRSVTQIKLRVDRATRSYISDGLLLVATTARENFRPYPGGRTVSSHKPWNPRFQSHIGRIYYSFAPPFQAAPPAVTRRSGGLQASIGRIKSITMTNSWGWMGIIGTDKKYAAYVEYGTMHMKKEPFMEKALDDNRSRLEALAQEKWAKAMAV